ATSYIYTLSLHDALPILLLLDLSITNPTLTCSSSLKTALIVVLEPFNSIELGLIIKPILFAKQLINIVFSFKLNLVLNSISIVRSEEHTSELQSRENLVC